MCEGINVYAVYVEIISSLILEINVWKSVIWLINAVYCISSIGLVCHYYQCIMYNMYEVVILEL